MQLTQVEPKDTTRHLSGELDKDGLSEEYLGFEKMLGFRPLVNLEGTPDDQRKVLHDGCALRDSGSMTTELRNDVSTTDETIKIGDISVPVRIYSKISGQSHAKAGALFFHGGGWVLGSIASDDIFCRMIANDLDQVVISVEYRLAPEAHYPAPVDDCYHALLWVVENAGRLNIDKSKVYVTGNSAGGHLAAAVALKDVEANSPPLLAAQVLRIPFTCHPDVYPGVLPKKENVPIFNDATTIAMANSFVPNVADRSSIYVSPLLASPSLLRKLPPAYVDVCSADPLYAGGVDYAKRLEENGVPVKLFILDGMPHGSYVLFPDMPSSKIAHKACMAGTTWALNGGGN